MGANDETRAPQRRDRRIAVYLIWGFLTLYWREVLNFDPIELIQNGWSVASLDGRAGADLDR